MRRVLPLAVGLALLGCIHQGELVPGPGAQTAPGRPRVAEETVEGVHVRVDSDAWRNPPVRDVLSPVRVTMQNGGRQPLRVSYDEFTLGGPTGFRLAALPPYQVRTESPGVEAMPPGFVGNGFLLAPWSAGYYEGVPAWRGGFPYDVRYYQRWGAEWPPDQPDREVIRQALPEGVLQPGGKVSGFLYFKDQPKGTELTFLAALVDADSGHVLGTVSIPFTVK